MHEQHPALWNKYTSLYDKAILHFLEQVEFLSPIHATHFFIFQYPNSLNYPCFSLGIHSHFEVFDRFFSDPSRSGRYHLTPQDRADIVVWMVQHYPSQCREVLLRQFCVDGWSEKKSMLLPLKSCTLESCEDMPIDVHLSRASPCAETLVDLIRSHNPRTFPSMGSKLNEAMTRYLLVRPNQCQLFLKAYTSHRRIIARCMKDSWPPNMKRTRGNDIP